MSEEIHELLNKYFQSNLMGERQETIETGEVGRPKIKYKLKEMKEDGGKNFE